MNDTIKLNSSTGSLQLATTGQGDARLDGGHNHTILHHNLIIWAYMAQPLFE